MNFKIGQEVKYRDIFKGKEVTGSIQCIVKIVDHKDESMIGKMVCYVSKGEGYVSDTVYVDDLKPVEV